MNYCRYMIMSRITKVTRFEAWQNKNLNNLFLNTKFLKHKALNKIITISSRVCLLAKCPMIFAVEKYRSMFALRNTWGIWSSHANTHFRENHWSPIGCESLDFNDLWMGSKCALRVYRIMEGNYYCNLNVMGSSHVTNYIYKKKL